MSLQNIISDVVADSEYDLDVRMYEVSNIEWDYQFTWKGRPNYDFTVRIEKDYGDEYTIWVKNSNQETLDDYVNVLRFVNVLDSTLNALTSDQPPSPDGSVGE